MGEIVPSHKEPNSTMADKLKHFTEAEWRPHNKTFAVSQEKWNTVLHALEEAQQTSFVYRTALIDIRHHVERAINLKKKLDRKWVVKRVDKLVGKDIAIR